MPMFFSVQKWLSIEPPIFAMINYIGVEGFTFQFPSGLFPSDYVLDRSELLTPEIMIENFDIESGEIMRPAFDVIWQSIGEPGRPPDS
jgi:aspartyl/asparaginyl-tRNA synthetase